MSQIHTQWSHFWRLADTVDFDNFSNAVVTLFIVDFDDVSIQKYGPLIIVMIIVKFVNG